MLGCDEAGRGSLAGPVVAACAVFDSGILKRSGWQKNIKDSKLLSAKIRAKLAAEIKKQALGWSVGLVQAEAIERLNIHRATLQAMQSAIKNLDGTFLSSTSAAIIDGRFSVPNISIHQTAVIDGDYKVFCVAAASILAKVYRDELMVKLHQKFPAYGFAQHKGYGTRFHIQQIRKLGISSAHRQSFCDHLI